MDTTKGIRLLAASLIMLGGIIHLAAIAVTTGTQMAIMAIFGVLYVVIAVGLFLAKRLFNYLGVVIPLAGTFVGGYAYVITREGTVLPLIAIDIAVILCCCYLILHKTSS
jgi:uncharacterized membrane protein (DUF2068 family)